MDNESTYDALFKAAVDIIQSLPKKGVINISTNQKLRLYSLFKQGIHGKCDVPCPPIWHVVDQMKWRAWDALGSMDSLEAKKAYIAELMNIINHVQHNYDIAELAKESDEQAKKLLRERLSILGYDISDLKMREDLGDFRKQLCNTNEESYEMRTHMCNNRTNELSDQCSESSTSTGEYIDALCCNNEPCICCREQLLKQRIDHTNDSHSSFSIFDIENLKIVMRRHLKKFLQSDIIMMASLSTSKADAKMTLPVGNECVKDTNVQLLLTKIDDLEKMKGAVSETLLDVVDKRIAYPRMITSYVSEAGKYRMKRIEEAELVWQTESMEKKDVKKMLEMINEAKKTEKENDALLQRFQELKRENEVLEKAAKMNDKTIRNMMY
ncbi:unnamed protein product [Acanthocheilonema viteae]|uniref:ACB domain-containing protein n=1 Tax=Acanthocheilonema viteae TaxID=6277 RepID=A0A498SLA4_ACAVI|nr:unnamed protein product [Acanthocheilonema viteae]